MFDKKAYQRDLMRKRRAAAKAGLPMSSAAKPKLARKAKGAASGLRPASIAAHTLGRILAELEAARVAAMANGHESAAVSAIRAKAALLGLEAAVDPSKKGQREQAAKDAGQGRYATPAPPRLVVDNK